MFLLDTLPTKYLPLSPLNFIDSLASSVEKLDSPSIDYFILIINTYWLANTQLDVTVNQSFL